MTSFRQKSVLLGVFLFCLALLGGCAAEPVRADFYAMNTPMEVTIYEGGDRKALAALAQGKVSQLDRLLSPNGDESELVRINSAGGEPVDLSPETVAMISRALWVSALTDGAFDLTIGPVTALWDVLGDHPAVPDDGALTEALEKVDWRQIALSDREITLPDGVSLDFGGAGKGLAADLTADMLRSSGAESALLDLGGNIYALGGKPDGTPFRVGLKDPLGAIPYVGVVEAQDLSVVTAGGYERYFTVGEKNYSHIFDPRTGYPADGGLLAVSVISPSSLDADLLSTSLFVLGLEKGLALYEENPGLFEAVFITGDKRIVVTEGLAGSFSFTGAEGGYAYAAP